MKIRGLPHYSSMATSVTSQCDNNEDIIIALVVTILPLLLSEIEDTNSVNIHSIQSIVNRMNRVVIQQQMNK